MHVLISFLILASVTFDYLAEQGAPKLITYLPEVVALVVSAYIVIVGSRTRFQFVRFEYWLVFGALLVVVLCGIVMNGVDTGPVFAGMRTYLRAIPLFFLPAVLAIEDRKLKRQLLLILALSFLQVPLALHQRITGQAAGHITGDLTVGTIMNSGTLSVFLICVACVLAGLYLRGRLSLMKFLFLTLIVLIPTTVNETKGTLVLAPIGLLTTFIAGAGRRKRLGNAVVALLVLSVFGAVFIPVYDYYARQRWGYGIIEFITMEGRVEGYLAKKNVAIGGTAKAGRVDAIVIPLRELSRDPPKLAFGLGMGNVSDSALGLQFTGEYFRRFEHFRQGTAAQLILETGLFGIALVFLLYYMIYRDARYVADHTQGLRGALAAGWTGVVAVIAVGTFYKDLIAYPSVSFLFWYFSGLVAADRMRLVLASQSARTHMAAVRQKRLAQPGAIAHDM